MTDLSVVFGTYNRLEMLEACVESVRAAVGKLDFEIVITDGGSTDGTLEYLRAQPDVILIEHGELLGAVKAYNDAFARAGGRYAAHLNDDLVVDGESLAEAAAFLDAHPEVGQVAFQYNTNKYRTVLGGKAYPFAAFGMTRVELGERAGWLGPFYHACGDIHLSLSVQKMGFGVSIGPGSVRHLSAPNRYRGEGRDGATERKDRELFNLMWGGFCG